MGASGSTFPVIAERIKHQGAAAYTCADDKSIARVRAVRRWT